MSFVPWRVRGVTSATWSCTSNLERISRSVALRLLNLWGPWLHLHGVKMSLQLFQRIFTSPAPRGDHPNIFSAAKPPSLAELSVSNKKNRFSYFLYLLESTPKTSDPNGEAPNKSGGILFPSPRCWINPTLLKPCCVPRPSATNPPSSCMDGEICTVGRSPKTFKNLWESAVKLQ